MVAVPFPPSTIRCCQNRAVGALHFHQILAGTEVDLGSGSPQRWVYRVKAPSTVTSSNAFLRASFAISTVSFPLAACTATVPLENPTLEKSWRPSSVSSTADTLLANRRDCTRQEPIEREKFEQSFALRPVLVVALVMGAWFPLGLDEPCG